jgi:DNA-binding CsgD family transcriptional regulator
MALQTMDGTVPLTPLADLHLRVIDYASRIEELHTPSEVLNELHDITTKTLPLSVLAAARLPVTVTDLGSFQLGQNAFLHKDVPKGWWEDFDTLALGKFCPLLFLAWSSMASCTWTEAKRTLQPVGVDRWPDELAIKYGMRDALSCPVGGRWVVIFWSCKDLSKILKKSTRNIIFAAASLAALRLEQLTDPNHRDRTIRLTPREIAVLRLVSNGAQGLEAARALGLGEETIRTHLKKAQMKLGARNRAHAACEALRQNLIP